METNSSGGSGSSSSSSSGGAGEASSEDNKLLENPKGCFFIFDAFHQVETADADDSMLLFYPEALAGKKVSSEAKSFLLGACSALINFVQRCVHSFSVCVC